MVIETFTPADVADDVIGHTSKVWGIDDGDARFYHTDFQVTEPAVHHILSQEGDKHGK